MKQSIIRKKKKKTQQEVEYKSRSKGNRKRKRTEFYACPRELLSGSSTTGSLLPSKAASHCTEISWEEVNMCGEVLCVKMCE